MAGRSVPSNTNERATAARLEADARDRITNVTARAQTATTAEEHIQLGRERAHAYGDLKAAVFVLTDEDTK